MVYACFGFQVSLCKVRNVCFSHINQKTQFENPVLEAKKKLNQEAAAIQRAAAAPSQGTSLTLFR